MEVLMRTEEEKERARGYQKAYAEAHPERVAASRKAWRTAHQEELREYHKAYTVAHRAEKRAYRKARQSTDAKYRISKCISGGMGNALMANKGGRHWESLVDYSLHELMSHLEQLFEPGMKIGRASCRERVSDYV